MVTQDPTRADGFGQQRRPSLDTESVQMDTIRGLDHDNVPPTPKEYGNNAWSPATSSITMGSAAPEVKEPRVPRWPFDGVEEHEHENLDHKSETAPIQPRQIHHDPPLPVVQRPGHRRHVLRYWSLEIATIIFSVLLLVAIIALLAYYDGRYMPEWPFQINLNSVIAFLTTFLRAAILAAVAEIIGQIKWTWFTERTRPLHHLQDFDAASRSVLGSFRLLGVVIWNCGFTSAGLLGISAALVTIASLAVGPFTQQAIKTTTCPQLVKTAKSAIPAANFVPGSSAYYRIGAGVYELEVDMKASMIQGMTDPTGKDSAVEVVCPTGNCVWPDYGTGITHSTIGMCSACVDTTSFVTGPNMGGNLTLPDEGSYINYGSGGQWMWVGYSNLTWASSLFSEDFAAAAAVSISNFSVLATSTSPCTLDNATNRYDCPHKVTQYNTSYYSYYDGIGDYVAASCIMYPCLKEYRARYENNILHEELVRTKAATPNMAESSDGYSLFYNYTASTDPCVLDNGTWYTRENQTQAPHTPGRTWANLTVDEGVGQSALDDENKISVPNACLYKMDGTFIYAVSNFLTNTLFSGQCYYDSLQAGHINCGESWWLTPIWGEQDSTFDSISGVMADFANVMTNKLRMTGAGPDWAVGEKLRRGEAYGVVFETSTCTFFDRRWVSLSVILVAICAILLIWIAVKNYRDPDQPVWKGSVLPLMFFGLHSPGGGGMAQSQNMSSLSPQGMMPRAERDRLDRNATFIRENGRAAPELDRIEDEAARMWVRFHGGTNPRFVDLGTIKNNATAASHEALVQTTGKNERGNNNGWSNEFKVR